VPPAWPGQGETLLSYTPRRNVDTRAVYSKLIEELEAEKEAAQADAEHARANNASGIARQDESRAHHLSHAIERVKKARRWVEED